MYATLLAILAAVSLTTALLPVSPRQAPGGVYVCANPAWKGPCNWQIPTANNDPKGDCIGIPYSLTMKWLSFGPDKDLKCAVYPETGCRGDPMSIRYPGSAHFPTGDAGGHSLSFRCVPEMTPIAVDPTAGKGDPDTYSAQPVIGS